MNRKLYLFIGLLVFVCILSIFVDSFKILGNTEPLELGTAPAGVNTQQQNPSTTGSKTVSFNDSEPDKTTTIQQDKRSLNPQPPTPKCFNNGNNGKFCVIRKNGVNSCFGDLNGCLWGINDGRICTEDSHCVNWNDNSKKFSEKIDCTNPDLSQWARWTCTAYGETPPEPKVSRNNYYPTTKLEFQLTFNKAVAANGLTLSDEGSSSAKKLIYGGTGVNNMYSVVSDATRGYVLQCANSANGYQYGYMTVKNTDDSDFRLAPVHTIMFWAKYSYYTGNVNHPVFIGSTSPSPTTVVYHYIMGDGVSSKFYAYVNGANATRPTNPHILNTWFHYACTYDGSTLSTYINGSFSSSTTGGKQLTSGGAVQIGNFLNGYNGTPANFNTVYGWMDNIRIYSTNLSAAEISTIYKYELANPTV